MLGRKNNGNRFLPFLIALFFSFLVSGCGRASDTSGLAGEWVLDAVNSGGISLPDLLVSNNRLALRLDADGIGQIAGENSEGRVKWSYDEGTLFLQTGSLFLTGTVENGTIILRTVDGETELRMIRQTEMSPEDGAVDTGCYAFLGEWYGWWKIENSSGDMPVSWYDCCAAFTRTEDGNIRMSLWDEDGSRTQPLSEIVLTQETGDRITSLNGYFDLMEIHKGELTLAKPDPALLISEIEHDSEGEHYSATVYLRPWGDRWEEAPKNQRPFYYEDWYLPLVNSGATMPDKIPWETLEERRVHP